MHSAVTLSVGKQVRRVNLFGVVAIKNFQTFLESWKSILLEVKRVLGLVEGINKFNRRIWYFDNILNLFLSEGLRIRFFVLFVVNHLILLNVLSLFGRITKRLISHTS
jgi:hypothetical protein